MGKEIWLSEEEQIYLKSFVKNGEHKAKEIIRARVLLMLDRTGKTDHVRYNRTAEYAGISVQAVYVSLGTVLDDNNCVSLGTVLSDNNL